MPVPEVRLLCPDIILVPQRVNLFRRAHNALMNEIRCEMPKSRPCTKKPCLSACWTARRAIPGFTDRSRMRWRYKGRRLTGRYRSWQLASAPMDWPSSSVWLSARKNA
jgi:hypothetical protein